MSPRTVLDIRSIFIGATRGTLPIRGIGTAGSTAVDLDAFALIADPDDRKFAALSAVVQRPLVTNDNDLLAARNVTGIDALTPRAFLPREGKKI